MKDSPLGALYCTALQKDRLLTAAVAATLPKLKLGSLWVIMMNPMQVARVQALNVFAKLRRGWSPLRLLSELCWLNCAEVS